MAGNTQDLLLRNVRPMGKAAVDVLVEGGRIKQVAAGIKAPRPDVSVVDGKGDILMPGFIEGHIHLDKILWGLPFRPITGGPELLDYINNEKNVRLKEVKASVEERAGNLIRQCARKGTVAIRSHVDIDPDYGLLNLEGVLAAKKKYADVVDIEIVIFPQSGVVRMPGTAELMDEALASGADICGGLDPSMIDKDPAAQLNILFKLAEKHNTSIDLHLHEVRDLGAFTFDLILDRIEAHSMHGRVVVAHAYCLGEVDPPRFNKLAERLAKNGVAIMTNAPGPRAMPPVRELRAAGVDVYSASDSIRDTWNPFGNGDMLERIKMVCIRGHMRKEEEIEMSVDMATRAAAKVLKVEGYGLEPGCKGDLVTIPGECMSEMIATTPERSLVVKGGRVVARNGVYEGPYAA